VKDLLTSRDQYDVVEAKTNLKIDQVMADLEL